MFYSKQKKKKVKKVKINTLFSNFHLLKKQNLKIKNKNKNKIINKIINK